MGAEMAARRGMKKQPLPQGQKRLCKDTSIISLQHSTEQFEGKEKAPNEADSNQNQKEAI